MSYKIPLILTLGMWLFALLLALFLSWCNDWPTGRDAWRKLAARNPLLDAMLVAVAVMVLLPAGPWVIWLLGLVYSILP